MRLSPAQTQCILQCMRQQFGPGTQVSLYGSRLDDAARGGDVDLLVETDAQPTLHQRALATVRLEQALQLPVDLLVVERGSQATAFTRVARARAKPLEAA
jgi:predicted nucleotidyltransferase